jgi:hypothetical protein
MTDADLLRGMIQMSTSKEHAVSRAAGLLE